jgi:hypothetical protein
MILSRVWYVVLGLAVAVSLYVVYLAVGQYDRQNARALREALASDSQTVEWALRIDSRRHIDALLPASVDPTLQQALVAANLVKEGKLPDKLKADSKKALSSIYQSIPADWRGDALFAIDRDGRVVGQYGFDSWATSDDFELGGYAVANDALHGWLRDDVWVFGSKMYFVVARPVEYDATQRPAGAVIALQEVSKHFVDDLARRTRTSVAFYAAGRRLAASSSVEGFDEQKFDDIANDLKTVDDKTYAGGERSEPRMLHEDLGVIYARLPGDGWTQGAGFAVLRAQTMLGGPWGFLSGADDKDKANVPVFLLVFVVFFAGAVGFLLTLLEHSLPLHELATQAARFKAGAAEGLRVARFRGAYRIAAQGINQGIERAIESAGGLTRKPADLESILGPTPAQPSMSAFSFPLTEAEPVIEPKRPPPVPSGVRSPDPTLPNAATPLPPARPPPSRPLPPVVEPPHLVRPPLPAAIARPMFDREYDDERTVVGAAPAEVIAQATGTHEAVGDNAEWMGVFDEFIRTKTACGEPTDGLTFEKFVRTLRKNRDTLIERHGCARVKFAVYVKDGHASLKATPVKE